MPLDGVVRPAVLMEFACQGGEAPTPYEVLFHAALNDHPGVFTHQDTVEETWRIVQPLLEDPPPLQTYRKGSLGPTAAGARSGPRTRTDRTPNRARVRGGSRGSGS